MSEDFKISDITVKKGTKVTSYLTVQDDAAGTVKLMVNVINGVEDGPVLAVTGGSFGTQYGGIEAIIRVFKEIDPKKVEGTLIMVPVMQMPAFQKGEDRSPIDGRSLQSSFPGDPDRSITYRIAYVVFNEVMKKSNYHLDIRGGDIREALIDYASVHETGNKQFDDENIAIAKILGVKYLWPYRWGKNSIITPACEAGIHSVTLMAYKGLLTFDEDDIQKCMRGIYNYLKYLKMIDGTPEVPVKIVQLVNESPHYTRAQFGGLLHLDAKFGDIVTKGQKVGEIRNLRGETVEVLTAPCNGVVTCIFPKPSKQPGDSVLNVRVPVK